MAINSYLDQITFKLNIFKCNLSHLHFEIKLTLTLSLDLFL